MESKYITIKQVSILINIGIPTINTLIRKKKIPSYKVGGKRLFDRDEILAWMKAHKEG